MKNVKKLEKSFTVIESNSVKTITEKQKSIKKEESTVWDPDTWEDMNNINDYDLDVGDYE